VSTANEAVHVLYEHQPLELARDELTQDDFQLLWDRYQNHVQVEEPSIRTGGRWRLVSLGWVGFIALREGLGLSLQPKVPLHNLFGMLEVAYRLQGLTFDDELTALASLQDFYDRLARLLALRVLDRNRRGLYRAYLTRNEDLTYLRGRLDLSEALRRPWRPVVPCNYQDLTADVEENQILAWTLFRILHGTLTTERSRHQVRRAWHALAGNVQSTPCPPRACVGRFYSRLNEDYQPLHALCRFFLECTGPSHHRGDRSMLPFLVSMDSLFEVFAAEWLRTRLPQEFELSVQHRFDLHEEERVEFKIDVVILDRATRRPLLVLDTKYKDHDRPSTDDLAQVVAYCTALGCETGVLVYPRPMAPTPPYRAGKVQVHALGLDLSGSIESGGSSWLASLLRLLGSTDENRT
jgi:5-methylcytosine-specific restriction enzyme subunit McrC